MIEWFETECRNTETKVTSLLWPITNNTDNPMNESKLQTNTRSPREAREIVCQRVTIGFGLLLIA